MTTEPKDEVETALKEGGFKDWEDFARFLFEENEELRLKLKVKKPNE